MTVVSIHAWGQGLTGDARDAFIRSSAARCMEAQRASPESMKFSDRYLEAYCECGAKRMADTTTEAEVIAIIRSPTHTPSPEFQEQRRATSEVCALDTARALGLIR
jgi:hypothetical protein